MKSPQDMRIIQIDITNACLYQCSNCTRFCGHHKKPFFMDFETFKRAVDSMKGYHGTIGVMGGEPTLHPEFERFTAYLASHVDKAYQKDHKSLIAPQKDFIESILLENKENSEVYEYHTGARETVTGAGLWSAMVPTYKKYYEIIQDTYKMQAVNDHGNIMYHSPILINRKDLGIPDEEWIKIRDNCWAQCIWSATITPKGAFFCEIAGALDMLFDGPGGWPIEEGWWERTPDEFGDQINWCEYCGIAIETFTRNANDWIDDVSDSMYRKLEEIQSPKLNKPDRINRVVIRNGVIEEKSKAGALEVRKDLFYDNFSSRFNTDKSILYPDGFQAIVETGIHSMEEIQTWLRDYGACFDFICIISAITVETDANEAEKIAVVSADGHWGHGFLQAYRRCSETKPIIYLSDLLPLNPDVLDQFRTVVLNPGTMHMTDMAAEKTDVVAQNFDRGLVAMFHKNAMAFKKIGQDYIGNANSFQAIAVRWEKGKSICFDSSVIEDTSYMRIKSGKAYAVYGAGKVGMTTINDIKKIDSKIVFLVDSDKEKWGTNIEGIPVLAPAKLKEKRDEYDQVVIASTYYKEVLETLLALGFKKTEIIVNE